MDRSFILLVIVSIAVGFIAGKVVSVRKDVKSVLNRLDQIEDKLKE